ncbi:MAG: 50S ribosomal protein L20 [Parcubacteria group bacterium CG1_02_37_51]|uniref:Large ribosomal subunit protein bL20 n=2 Tax=Candidatus Komeiliibacteriota TaxID=1817908 RepID=A0A2M8DQL8_9BACT|nr:MAG: 50S ribosomal protein L20 [Parcubacteria group bacterium CG1_02_37_51]PIY93967.1 MAG: 50S ribosomal protein L20 [Candidatus Komeilibacteria bacterium CG_4_10_14_0_8_um_filter_37_78]PJC01392.1 MAG: 50S ribosomal protein L20 [Candidatus Komeilibacteria bacterium CG_4_9_14_0_8_um_filter_36_9]
MPRVKRGTSHAKKRKRLRKEAKGFKWGRKTTIRLAKTAVTKAGAHAFVDRRKKKRVMRRLWQTRLNAAVRQYDLTYSKFIDLLKKNSIELDRKVLSEIAVKQPDIFKKIIDQLK